MAKDGVNASSGSASTFVKVKTPDYPIQLAGKTSSDLIHCWKYEAREDGVIAKAFDETDKLIGFVVSGEYTKQAFPLLRELT